MNTKGRVTCTRPSLRRLLELVVRAEDLDDLVDVELLHRVARRSEVLARVEVLWMLGEVLADRRRHREARVGVDVDLAHRALRRLAQLLLGNADRVGELAAELVDRVDVLLRDAGRAVEDDREAGELLLDGLEDVERERGRDELARLLVARALLGLELVGAVRGADGDREGVAAGLGRELDHFLGLRVVALLGLDFVFDAGEDAELGLDRHVVLVRVVDDLLGELDVVLERKGAAVDHDRREAGVNAALASLVAVAVVEVEDDLRLLAAEFLGVLNRAFGHVAENRGVRVLARALGDLHDDGRLGLDRGLDDGLHLLHRVEVECGNGVTALDRLCEHFLGVDETKLLVADHLWVSPCDFPIFGNCARVYQKLAEKSRAPGGIRQKTRASRKMGDLVGYSGFEPLTSSVSRKRSNRVKWG